MGEQVDARLLWGCSSVGRAPALQAGGHEFESHHLHDSIKPCKFKKTGRCQACLNTCMDFKIYTAQAVTKRMRSICESQGGLSRMD